MANFMTLIMHKNRLRINELYFVGGLSRIRDLYCDEEKTHFVLQKPIKMIRLQSSPCLLAIPLMRLRTLAISNGYSKIVCSHYGVGDIHNKPVIVTSHEALLTDNAVGKRWALIYFMAHLFLRDITTANSLNTHGPMGG